MLHKGGALVRPPLPLPAVPLQQPKHAKAALLPAHRIVAYYGNPSSARMGILGALPLDSMQHHLDGQVRAWALADSTLPVLPALHLVTIVAQSIPGASAKYRLRAPDTLIERISDWAEQHDELLFLDVQVGRSTVAEEVGSLTKYLSRPWVHLALDPEFAMDSTTVPGCVIGSLDAREVNVAIDTLIRVMQRYDLPPRILVVHRFTEKMLTGSDSIRLDPRVQVVIDMDGFGPPGLKRGAYRAVVGGRPVQYTGFKLFYQQDRPLMTPAEVLALKPPPLFILYQ